MSLPQIDQAGEQDAGTDAKAHHQENFHGRFHGYALTHPARMHKQKRGHFVGVNRTPVTMPFAKLRTVSLVA
jgi:hypothetical protein